MPSKPKINPNRKTLTAEQIKAIIPDYRVHGATLPQARFTACYIANGLNAAQAYRDATNQPKLRESSASAQGQTYLHQPEVRTLLQAYTANFIQNKKDELEPKILKTLWGRAFWDPKDLFDLDGQPKFASWEDVPEPLRMAIEGIELQYFGTGATRSAVKFKMANRQQSLAMLAQYVGMLKGIAPGDDGKPGPGAVAMDPQTLVSLQSLYAAEALKVQTPAKKGAKTATEGE